MEKNSQDQVLVAIINNKKDFSIANHQHWYRIPVTSVEKWLKNRWPPDWMAFYLTKVFGEEAWAIIYYARVLRIEKLRRAFLFPDESRNPKSNRLYYRIFMEPLRRLPQPIYSRRLRRIVFIPTTWEKFINASEINDLFDDSPLEDRLWAEFKRLKILAERQEFVKIGKNHYALDFAIYCESGKIDVETDGDFYHTGRENVARDNLRDNDLETEGWRVLRFNTEKVRESVSEYCISTVAKNINKLGGIKEGKFINRKIQLDSSAPKQLNLFDEE